MNYIVSGISLSICGIIIVHYGIVIIKIHMMYSRNNCNYIFYTE